MKRETENTILHLVRIVGYFNLAWLVVLFLSFKLTWEPWSATLPVAISLLGALLYYTQWNRLVRYTPRTEGRRFARPYILGTALVFATVVLLAVFGWLGNLRAQ
jgi:hypothetical protein